jgi:hypothetical protein
VTAEIRAGLVAHFFRRWFAAVFGNARIVIDTHAAHVQLGAALRALIASHQWQAQRSQ